MVCPGLVSVYAAFKKKMTFVAYTLSWALVFATIKGSVPESSNKG